MKKLLAMVVFCAATSLSQQAFASGYCGAATFNCCPTVACQPSSCYTTCKIERQTCKKTVYDTVWEPEEITRTRTVYETAYETKDVTCYKVVRETAYRECEYEVRDRKSVV